MSLRRLLRIVDRESMFGTEAHAVRAAFATTDMKHVDQHFGTSHRYAIYRVTPHRATLSHAAQFAEEDKDGGEGKLTARIALLEGCALVYCVAVGGGAIRRLVARGIRPLRVAAATPIAALLTDLQAELSQDAEVLRRRFRVLAAPRDEARFDAMEAEGWVE